jgi:hypothetical protein
MEVKVGLFIEPNCPLAQKLDLSGSVHAFDQCLDTIGIDRVGAFAGKSEHNGAIGAMPPPGQRQRAVEINANSGNILKQAIYPQTFDKPESGAHWADRVRTGRTDAYFKQVEDAQEHFLGSLFK